METLDVMPKQVRAPESVSTSTSSSSSSSSWSSSVGSDCSSGRIAPYVSRDSPPSSVHYERKPAQTSTSKSQPSSASAEHKPRLVLDEASRARLIQSYTTANRSTIVTGQVECQFTCIYITAFNFEDFLFPPHTNDTTTPEVASNEDTSSPCQPAQSRCAEAVTLANLISLTRQSWRVTPGTLDFLELIWTGRRSHKNWADLVTRCTCFDSDGEEDSDTDPKGIGSCPKCRDNDAFLALNLSVTYHFAPSGQPVMSLTAIVMTQDVFDAVAEYASSDRHGADREHGAKRTLNNQPVVNRTPLVSTLCRWRNTNWDSVLHLAADGRAWSGRTLPKVQKKEDRQTISPSASPSVDGKGPPEWCAMLIPGRDATFRMLVSELYRNLDRNWIRRSSQISLVR